MTIKIAQRITEIESASNIEFLVNHQIGNCHLLKRNRKNQYAMTLEQPFRLIFCVVDHEIQIVEIQEIVDYH